jgi:hypothetical protein
VLAVADNNAKAARILNEVMMFSFAFVGAAGGPKTLVARANIARVFPGSALSVPRRC